MDLQNDEGLSLQIEQKTVDDFCEMAISAVVQEKIVVPKGSKANLSFLDCPKDNLVVTATRTIGNHKYPLIWFQQQVCDVIKSSMSGILGHKLFVVVVVLRL